MIWTLQGHPLHKPHLCWENKSNCNINRSKEREGYDSLDRIELVVNWGCGACQMIDLIDFQKQRLNNIMADELKPRISKMMHHILLPASEEVVHNNDAVSPGHQLVHKMAANESRSSCHHNSERLPLQTERKLGARADDTTDMLLFSCCYAAALVATTTFLQLHGGGAATNIIYFRNCVPHFPVRRCSSRSMIMLLVVYTPHCVHKLWLEEKEDRRDGHTYHYEHHSLLPAQILHRLRQRPWLLRRLRRVVPRLLRNLRPPVIQAHRRHHFFPPPVSSSTGSGSCVGGARRSENNNNNSSSSSNSSFFNDPWRSSLIKNFLSKKKTQRLSHRCQHKAPKASNKLQAKTKTFNKTLPRKSYNNTRKLRRGERIFGVRCIWSSAGKNSSSSNNTNNSFKDHHPSQKPPRSSSLKTKKIILIFSCARKKERKKERKSFSQRYQQKAPKAF